MQYIDRKTLDAARDVEPGDPLIISYTNGAFVGVAIGSTKDQFRAACRALLTNHSTEEARTLFDQELQRAIHGGGE